MFSAFQTFGKLGALASSVARAWSPTTLFAAGEKGGLWDFSTLANLYKDSAGTTPCTAVGDPIGKVLDTSGRGNHLTQPTSTKRPTLGRMPATGVRNLLTYTEDLTNAAWGKSNLTVTAGQLAPDATNTATLLIATAANGWHYLSGTIPANVGDTVTRTVFLKAAGYDTAFVCGQSDADAAYVNLTLGTVLSTPPGVTTSILPAGGGWYKVTVSRVLTVPTSSMSIGIGAAAFPGDTVSGILVWRPQNEIGSTVTAYQKVGAAYDVTESGVASVYTAYFDGVDDCLVSPSIDFSGTDAMSVFAGFRKTSDAARGMVAELSATTASNNGSFALTAPNAASATIVYESKGTSLTDTSATIAAPADSVISAVSDISADSNVLRRNGVQTDSDTGDQGTGNFGNYPLYVGQRAAASVPYKGFLSALCTRGAATDAATVTSMEKWLAARTPGVTLP